MNSTYYNKSPLGFPVSIAPMMDYTDRHYRYFMRKISKKTILYTEMISTSSILHGNQKRLLAFDKSEHPLVLQLGGNNPEELARCVHIASEYSYDAINLNVGCPSDRVSSGCLGASLMAHPELVRDCISAMSNASEVPISVKHRIGIDNFDTYEFMKNFIQVVSESGCNHFIIHARIAMLQGLSPKANRTVPPLRYNDVYRIKKELQNLYIEINGGIKDQTDIKNHLKNVDAVMIGRQAYENPFMFSNIDEAFDASNSPTSTTRREIALSMIPYIEKVYKETGRIHTVTRHMLNLMKNCPGGRNWRRVLGNSIHWSGTIGDLITDALKQIPDEILDSNQLAIGNAALQTSPA